MAKYLEEFYNLLHKIEIVVLHSDTQDRFRCFDDHVWVNGVPRGVWCHFSPSGSNSKNKNKSPMLTPILFHEVIINKCICHRFYFVHCRPKQVSQIV